MGAERTEVLIVGGGQAGIAMSEHLSARGIEHLVLEKSRIAERWRSQRWDSLVTNGPVWHDRFPNMEFPGLPPEAFAHKDAVADYFVAYAERIRAPIRCGVEVTSLHRREGRWGFRAETTAGPVEADFVVAATGPFQAPLVPPLVPEGTAGVLQIHSTAYRNPDALPDGAVLVVGAGSSGAQIADELVRAGRRVFLSVGPHDRPPRRYRGRDFVWWLGVLGDWDAEAVPGAEHVTIAVSGAHGGETVEFRRFAERGITLLGRVEGHSEGRIAIAPDLATNLRRGDSYYLRLLDRADAWVARYGYDLPEEPEARLIPPDPRCVAEPLATLDLRAEGIGTIIWATGFRFDFGWLRVNALDAEGRPCHQRGVSPEPGLFFLGLPWLTRRGSSFIWGVWHDAMMIADRIETQRRYLRWSPDRPR